MEFIRTKTTEITVFDLESNSAIDPSFFKVVWRSEDRNVTNQVVCWKRENMAIDEENLYTEQFTQMAGAAKIDGIPTVKKSTELLETLLRK